PHRAPFSLHDALPISRETFEEWARQTPDDFVFVLKMSRFLTHLKRLKDPEELLERFFEGAGGLGKKLGPVLIQLPPNFHKDLDRDRKSTRLNSSHVSI